MKILAPFDAVKEIRILIDVGADELYCGIHSDYWDKKGIFSNARHMFYGNLSGFEELKEAVAITKRYAVPIYLCANDYLPQDSFKHLLKDISLAIEIGVNGIIIADISLIPLIKKENFNCKIILSCLNPCFNSLGLEFYKGLSIDRITLPFNQFTLEEIEDISLGAQRLNLELELFVNNVGCQNIAGYCLFQDFLETQLYKRGYRYTIRFAMRALRIMSRSMPSTLRGRFGRRLFTSKVHPLACKEECELEKFKRTEKGIIKEETIRYYSLDRYFAQNYCGLCSLYFLEKYNITTGKIVGRGYTTQRKIKDIIFAKRYLDGLKTGSISGSNFVENGMNIYRDIFGEDCWDKQCHYAQVNRVRKIQKNK